MFVRAAGVVLLTFFAATLPQPVSADVAKCESKLLKTSSKLGSGIFKAFSKCTASARKTISKKGAIDDKTADKCEKNLKKVFNIGGDAGKGTVNKTLKSFRKLFTPGKEVCTSADLVQLGLLESGVNAPGTNPEDFLSSWLIMRETNLALTQVFSVAADVQEVLTSMIDLTDCDDPLDRPNLCTFRGGENPDCVTQTCNLSSTSDLTLQPDGLTAALQDNPATIQVCRAPAALTDLPVDFSDSFRALSLAGATRLGPTTLTGANATVCIDQLRAIGWCDCDGAAVAFEPDTCRDHIANDNAGTCSETSAFCLTDEDCTERNETCSATVDDCGVDLANAALPATCVRAGTPAGDCQGAPGKCIDGTTVGPCHPGTYIGATDVIYGGSSAGGDCSLTQTLSLRILPPAVCVNPAGDALGSCTTLCPGPGSCGADATCLGLGGTACAVSAGADGVPCTRDDLAQPGPTQQVVFTTGTATASVKDLVRINFQGVCSGGSTNAGMNCISNEDCIGGTCSGVVPLPNPAAVNASGSPLTCADYDSGNLSGLTMVGGFAWFNGVRTGDQTAMITLDCD